MTSSVETALITLLPEQVIDTLPWEDLHGAHGVRTKVLWRAAGSLAGLMALEAGATLPSHAHADGHHHILVRQGTCRVRGNVLPTGSYVHVTAGEPHDIGNETTERCEVFYLYLST